ATTVAALHLATAAGDRTVVTGCELAPGDVDRQLARLAAATIAERRAMTGMEPERADVIVGGVAILARVLRRAAAPRLITSDRGIRWGLAYERMSSG
ncbi:MAG: Ppx/GppA family phosphatase, partial [Myxococcota bacterium]|nr:Ppx/GppA family phosphatase [Myxococcota bacterium]